MKLVLVLFFMAFSMVSMQAHANDIAFTLSGPVGQNEQLTLEFANHTVVNVSSESSAETTSAKGANELLLRFDQPIGQVATAPIRSWIGPVLIDVRYGYDSLLFVFQDDIVWNVELGVGIVTVNVAKTAVTPEPERQVSQHRSQEETLDYLTAASALEAGDLITAERLVARYTTSSSDSQWRELDARLRLARGDWRSALRRLRDEKSSVDLGSADSGLVQAIEKAQGNTVDLSLYWRNVSNADSQQTYRIDGRSLLVREVRVGAWVEHRKVDVPAVRQGLQPAQSADLAKSYLGAWVDWGLQEHSARASLYGNPDSNGVGVDYVRRLSTEGEFIVSVARSRPYLDYVEGVTGDATRDVMSAGYETNRGRFSFQGEVARYWYDLATVDNVADSVGARFGLSYGVRENDPRLAMRYGFDYEDVASVKRLRDVNGVAFAPLPLSDRATHALGLEWNDSVSNRVRYTLSTGYSYDPNTLSAPYFLARGDFQMNARVSSSLFAGRTVAVESGSDQSVTSFGAQLKVLF